MRIAHVAPTALSDISAAWRIKAAQRGIGLDAIATVQIGKQSNQVFTFDQSQKLAFQKKRFFERVDSIPIRLSPDRDIQLPLSAGWVGRNISPFINSLKPDIVNLHWLTNGAVNLNDLAYIKAPIVLTMHDVWPITGGCHCNLGCNNWLLGCKDCPQLGKSLFGMDIAPILLKRKERSYTKIPNLVVVSPSHWLADMASKSKCFEGREIVVIPNCLNLEIFQPTDKLVAKSKLGLPADKLIISFGAVNARSVPYKGYDLLIKVMQILYQRNIKNIYLLIFGASGAGAEFPFQSKFLGNIEDERDLANIYQASDIFVSPSRQDNFPSTVVEATASGTPVVAFNVGGVSDLISHCESGYLARPFDPVDFADGISWLSDSPQRLSSVGASASNFTSRYCNPDEVANKYKKLYMSLI